LNGIYLSCKNLSKPKKAGAGNLSLSKIITGALELCLSSEPYISFRVWSKCALKIKGSGQEYDKEHDQNPEEILRFKRLAKSPGLAIEKGRKGESELVDESTDS